MGQALILYCNNPPEACRVTLVVQIQAMPMLPNSARPLGLKSPATLTEVFFLPSVGFGSCSLSTVGLTERLHKSLSMDIEEGKLFSAVLYKNQF